MQMVISSIILLTKKVIYNAMLKNKKNILIVKYETKNFYFQERYILFVRKRKNIQ